MSHLHVIFLIHSFVPSSFYVICGGCLLGSDILEWGYGLDGYLVVVVVYYGVKYLGAVDHTAPLFVVYE